MLEKSKMFLPKFVVEGYIIPDGDGCWGTSGARLEPNAPQWAKDEYKEWRKEKEEALKTMSKL